MLLIVAITDGIWGFFTLSAVIQPTVHTFLFRFFCPLRVIGIPVRLCYFMSYFAEALGVLLPLAGCECLVTNQPVPDCA